MRFGVDRQGNLFDGTASGYIAVGVRSTVFGAIASFHQNFPVACIGMDVFRTA